MIPDCHPDELAQVWTLSEEEWSLLASKSGATRLSFALLLKLFQHDGQFPERREVIATIAIAFVTQQVGVAIDVYDEVDWSERTQRQHRAQIRDFCEVSAFRAEDEPDVIVWLSDQVMSLNPETEALKLAAYNHLRDQHIEPPGLDRLRRLLRTAVHVRETRFVAATVAQLSPATCAALDRLIQTGSLDEDSASDQTPLFPIRSGLATLKEDAGAVKVETVREEIEKLIQLRAVGLPDDLFRDTPARFVTHYRQRAAGENPRMLRRHPADIHYALLAALCWQRQREITDSLVDLLIHIAQCIGVRAEAKVDIALQQYAKRFVGKTKLLYKLAKAATERPEGIVKEVIFLPWASRRWTRSLLLRK